MPDPPPAAGPVLTDIARRAIARRLRPGDASDRLRRAGTEDPRLLAPGASFVTLTVDGRLRGCIGSLTAERPLGDDVAANAEAAAFRDPRFPPLTAGELPVVHIEVSVLSAPEELDCIDETEACARLRPGIDGVILRTPGHRATFLPQVWEKLPDPHTFLAQLRRKAGLSADYWGNDLRLSRYTVTAFHEGRPPS